jgi:hypothetical protein
MEIQAAAEAEECPQDQAEIQEIQAEIQEEIQRETNKILELEILMQIS